MDCQILTRPRRDGEVDKSEFHRRTPQIDIAMLIETERCGEVLVKFAHTGWPFCCYIIHFVLFIAPSRGGRAVLHTRLWVKHKTTPTKGAKGNVVS